MRSGLCWKRLAAFLIDPALLVLDLKAMTAGPASSSAAHVSWSFFRTFFLAQGAMWDQEDSIGKDRIGLYGDDPVVWSCDLGSQNSNCFRILREDIVGVWC